MSTFRRQRLSRSIQRKQRTKLARSIAPCAIEGLEERQLMSLMIDVRMADGSKAANVTSAGQTVTLDVFAVVTGVNSPGTKDGFQEVIGSLLSTSTAPGSVLGDMSADLPSPFNQTASQTGTSQDLDGDSDLDIGSNDTTTSDNYFFPRDGGMDFNGTVSGNTNTFEIATVSFTVDSLVYGQATDINFFPKLIPDFLPAAIWREDNNPLNNQNGTLLTGSPVVITSNAAPPVPTGSISGTVFNDTNNNGKQDSGETGVNGAVVYIDSNNNGVRNAGEEEATTNSSGHYSLTELPAGSYVVRQITSSGEAQTTPAAGTGNSITLSNGQTLTNSNFGDTTTGTISGTIFSDLNGNGSRDAGENGIKGVTVYVDANNNGKLDNGEKSTTTDANGVFGFFNLPAGSHVIRQVLPSGDTQTSPTNGAGHTVSLSAGQAFTDGDFADKPSAVVNTGSITGTVFIDVNGNGKQDSGDLGIGGITVYNDATNVGAFVSGDLTAVTNASGVYSFSGLSAGAYLIRQVLPSGDTQDFPTNGFGNHVTLTSGQAASGVNFGDKGSAVPPPTGGSITGTVFNDINGNGVQDSGDLGIAGVTVYNDATNVGAFVSGDLTTVTNASGVYSFTNLPAGAYLIRQTLPSGDTQDFPTKGFGNHVTLATNQAATNVNFGDQGKSVAPTGSISGTVFTDTNGNGAQDSGELGISGVTVYIDANKDGVLDSGDTSTTTNGSGVYTFGSLAAGPYVIRQVLPSGKTQDSPASNGGDNVTLTSGQAATNINFGDQNSVVATGGSITGTVFADANGNGKQDAGELGIAGVFVYNDANNNGKFDAGELNTTTNASGVYTLTSLPAGAYLIRQTLPTGDTQTFPSGGFGNHVTLAANQVATGANFGDKGSTVTPPPNTGGLTGTVFNDANGNGKQDSGDLGINGVTVYLDLNNSGAFKTGDPETTTNASGVYSFSGLTAGAYVVRQILPVADKQTLPSGGLGNHVTVVAGQIAANANFGDESSPVVVGPPPGGGSITGTVFNDANGNGKQDSGELGIANVEVYLDVNNAGFFVAGDPETTTNASGVYSFSGLAFGLYIVRQIPPSGDTQTTPAGNLGIHITLATNQASTGDNFGDKA